MATRTLSISDLRAHLAAAIEQVEAGDRLLLTRHDRVVAALVPPDAGPLSPLEERAAALLAQLGAPATETGLPEVVADPELDVEEWVSEVRAARR